MKIDTQKQPIDISKQKRFEYIETQLFWGKGLKAGKLAETFGLSRQAAQAVIDSYRKQYPGQMTYNSSRKQHEPSEDFEPMFIRTSPISFLDYLRGEKLMSYYRQGEDWSDIEITDVDRLLRPDLPLRPIRVVLSALLNHQVVRIVYHSKDQEPSTRSISPNHLIFADDRYHVRAYCHLKNAFLDFVLSRISYAELTDEGWVPSREDGDWNYTITLRFKPNPNLPESVRNSILKSYEDIEEGYRIVKCRMALVIYVRRNLLADNPKYGMPLWVEYR